MEKSTSRWLIGCGLGCLGLIVLVVAFAVGSAFLVRSATKGFETASRTGAELDRKFGKADEFQPWADGAVPASRMEVFVAVRETTQPAREEVARSFRKLPIGREEAQRMRDLPFWQKAKKVWSMVGTGIGLGSDLGEFFKARNETLLREEMGMGEYTYLYVIVYNSWLKHDPDDGVQDLHGGVKIDTHRFERSQRGHLLAMLEAQHEAADEGAWKKRLGQELEALRADSTRVPWQDGLPTQLEQSLTPFRERLESTYDPITNEFELSVSRKQGSFGYQVD